MSIETIAYGGDHGTDFDIQAIHSIGFRETPNKAVEAVLLNGTRFGDVQGPETVVLELQQDEYLTKLVMYQGHSDGNKEIRILGIELATNRGRELKAGLLHKETSKILRLENVRILGLGGNAGHQLFKLRARYIKGYTESKLILSDAVAVTGVIPQGQTFETFESSRVARMKASRTFIETATSVTQSTESGIAAGEFSAKASMTFGLTVTTQQEFSEQFESETETSKRITYSPPEGHVGLEVVTMQVFEASDGTCWSFPTSEPAIVSAAVAGEDIPTDKICDMTGILPLHLPYLAEKSLDFRRFTALAKAG